MQGEVGRWVLQIWSLQSSERTWNPEASLLNLFKTVHCFKLEHSSHSCRVQMMKALNRWRPAPTRQPHQIKPHPPKRALISGLLHYNYHRRNFTPGRWKEGKAKSQLFRKLYAGWDKLVKCPGTPNYQDLGATRHMAKNPSSIPGELLVCDTLCSSRKYPYPLPPGPSLLKGFF